MHSSTASTIHEHTQTTWMQPTMLQMLYKWVWGQLKSDGTLWWKPNLNKKYSSNMTFTFTLYTTQKATNIYKKICSSSLSIWNIFIFNLPSIATSIVFQNHKIQRCLQGAVKFLSVHNIQCSLHEEWSWKRFLNWKTAFLKSRWNILDTTITYTC